MTALATAIYNVNVGQGELNVAVFPQDQTKPAAEKPHQLNRFLIFDVGLQRQTYTGKARKNADDFFQNTLKWKAGNNVEANAPVVDWLVLSHPDEDHYTFIPWLVAKYKPRFVNVMTSSPNWVFGCKPEWVPSGGAHTLAVNRATSSPNLIEFVRDFYQLDLQWNTITTRFRFATCIRTSRNKAELSHFAEFKGLAGTTDNYRVFSVNPGSWGTRINSAAKAWGNWMDPRKRNAASVNIVIAQGPGTTRNNRVIMTADSTNRSERLMIKHSGSKTLIEDCAVCKIAHHGSSGSSGGKALGKTFPQWAKPSVGAIVSAGAHGHSEHLPRMDAMYRWEQVCPNLPSKRQYLYFFTPEPTSGVGRIAEWNQIHSALGVVKETKTNLRKDSAVLVNQWNNRETNKAIYAMFLAWNNDRPLASAGWQPSEEKNFITVKGWCIDLQANGTAPKIHSW